PWTISAPTPSRTSWRRRTPRGAACRRWRRWHGFPRRRGASRGPPRRSVPIRRSGPRASREAGMTVRQYQYKVDADGRVFHDGSEIVDPATLRFFLLGMRREVDGRWLVPCQGEQNWFSAEETPFVVQRLRLDVEGGRLRRVG